MLFRIGVLLLPLLLACTPPSRTAAHTMTDKEWMLEKPAHITNVADYDRYPILAEKSGCLLVSINGVETWVHISPAKVPPLVKTNEYGFCENVAVSTNKINVYERPDISSTVIDTIANNYLVQIVDVASYFVKISTPKIETFGWVYKKDLSNYTDWNNQPKSVADISEDNNFVYIGNKKHPLGKNLNDNNDQAVDKIYQKSILVSKNDYDVLQQTYSDFSQVSDAVEACRAGKAIRYYEQMQILEKLNDGGAIIQKRFGFFADNEKDGRYLASLMGESTIPFYATDFYNKYGDKTGTIYCKLIKGKYQNYHFSEDTNYILIQGADSHQERSKDILVDLYGFFDKYGRCIKKMNAVGDNINIYYKTIKNESCYITISFYNLLSTKKICEIKVAKPYNDLNYGINSNESGKWYIYAGWTDKDKKSILTNLIIR
ncbi:MAG: SH3 domain-containing protein [Spirochaetes bacterium]|nr:SH3 domain-containing protein [Spirochaetota bacterium]